MKRKIKINHDYFSLSNRWDNIKYFLRQGHVVSHIFDRVKWHWYPKYCITPAFPTHIDIETSSACQLRCPMCRTTEMVRKGVDFSGIMDLKLYKKLIDECSCEHLFSVKLSWRGEPLLNPNIAEMIHYAKDRGIKNVAFLTNGERLNQALIKELVVSGLDWISISFDGMGDTYNRIRQPAVFEETLEKVCLIRKYKENLGRYKPLIRIQSVYSAISGEESKFLKLWKGVADRVNFIADQKRTIQEDDYKYDAQYICPSPWQRITVSWDGKVAQCCEDYMEGNILGDAKEKTLKEIWHDRPFILLRENMKGGRRLLTRPCRICADGCHSFLKS